MMNQLWGINMNTLWFAIGFFMLAAELLTTGFVFIFLGLGALLTGLLIFMGLEISISTQLILFVVLSFTSLMVLRNPLKKWFDKSKQGEYNNFKGETCEVIHWNNENSSGTVKFRGTQWQAQSQQPMQIGQQASIESVEGITLTITS